MRLWGRGVSRQRVGRLGAAAAAGAGMIVMAVAPAQAAVTARQQVPQASGPTASAPGANGTIAAERGAGLRPGGRGVHILRHASSLAPADASGDLSTVLSETVNGGYTAAGVGMRNQGYGTISITGVPAGATVVSATLLWDVLGDDADPTFAAGTFDATAITGTEWASGATPCWDAVTNNFSYEADVTSLVSGNGNYALAGFASGDTNGQDPWLVGTDPPMLEGASLVVVYSLASMPSANIQIGEGATESDSLNEADASMDGFTVPASPEVTTTYIVGDGQEPGNTAGFDGETLADVSFPGGDPQAVPSYSQGSLWDTVTTDVSSLVSTGDTSEAMSVTGDADCIVWVGQVLDVSTSAAPSCLGPQVLGAYLVTAEEGSCLVDNAGVYTDTGPVNLNGLTITPLSGMVTIDDSNPPDLLLSADDATVQIGSFTVYSGAIQAIELTGRFSLSTDDAATIGDLPLSGDIDLDVSGTDGLTVTGKIGLPEDLGGTSAALSATMDAANGLTKVGASVNNFFIPIGNLKVGLKDFSLSYDLTSGAWTGSLTVGLPTPAGTEVEGSVTIARAQVTDFSVQANNLNKPLGPDGVFLQEIGAALHLKPPPSSITGTAGITAGPQIDDVAAMTVDGSMAYIFGSPGDFRLAGDVKLLDGTDFEQTLADGQFDYYTDGHITVGGQAKFDLSAGVTDDASMSGWVDGTSAFSLSGTGEVKIFGLPLAGSTSVVSSVGIAGCGHPFAKTGASIGFGYRWGHDVSVLHGSCDLGPYTAAQGPNLPAGDARSAGMTLPPGLPVASFAITGSGGTAPAGQLASPSGKKLSINPAKPGLFTKASLEYGLAVDAAAGIDYVVIAVPAGGTWTFTPARGSAVKSVATAQGLSAPKISAKVTGKGLGRKLTWRIAHVQGQKVTFVEETKGVDQVLVSNLSAGSGHRSFTPADGPAGLRSIVAVVTQNGLTSESVKVASYRAPATETLEVTVQHSGSGSGFIRITPGGSCKAACTLSELTGASIKLAPVPAHGSAFSWTQGVCSGSGVCTIKLTQLFAVAGRFTS
jgi:hypothetical protein